MTKQEKVNPFVAHLQRELDITKTTVDTDVWNVVCALLDNFLKAGHSVFSANFGINKTIQTLRATAKRQLVSFCETWWQAYELTDLYKADIEASNGEDDIPKWLANETLIAMELMGSFNDIPISVVENIIHLYKTGAKFDLISPLTGNDDEWIDAGPFYLNNRCSEVFKDVLDDNVPYHSRAIIFSDDGGITWFTCQSTGSNKVITFPYTPTKTFLLCDKEHSSVITKPITELAVGDKVTHFEQGAYIVDDIKGDIVTVIGGVEKNKLVLPISDFIGPDVIKYLTYNTFIHTDDTKAFTCPKTVPYTTWFKPDEYVEEPIDDEEPDNLQLSRVEAISDDDDLVELNQTTYVDEYTITDTVLADREALITAFADFVRSLDNSHPLTLSMVTKDKNDNT